MIYENIINIKKTIDMALIDLKKIYRGTLLGWIWIIAKPGMAIFVYWFAFSVGLRVGSSINGYSYFLWLVSGLIPWFFIADVLSSAPGIFKKYNYLVTKMTYPVATIPVFTTLSSLLVHLLLLVVFIVVYYLSSGMIDSYFLQLPIIITITFIFMSNISMIFGIIGSFSKDLANFIKTIITPLLFLSPIFWRLDSIKLEWLINVQKINPIHFIINSYRNVFIYKESIFKDQVSLYYFLLFIIITTIIASLFYKKIKKEIPDYL